MLKKFFNIYFILPFLTIFHTASLHAEDLCSDPVSTSSSCDPACAPREAFVFLNEECSCSFWLDIEYLYWKFKDGPAPIPLVFQGPTVPDLLLTSPDTAVILGGRKFDSSWRSGGKFVLGYRFDEDHDVNVEVSYFFFPKNTIRETINSDGTLSSPLLRIPFYNIATGEDATNLSLPGVFSGTATHLLTNSMQGAELNISAGLPDRCAVSMYGIGGFRYWNFKEYLTFDTSSPNISPPLDTFLTHDQFTTENSFYGVQGGLLFKMEWDRISLSAKGKLAIGGNVGKVVIDGYLITNDFNDFGATQEFLGGYYALPTSIGTHRKTRFAIIPEINANLGYQILDCVRLEVGYTVLFVSNVLRAGNQIDRIINTSQSTAITNDPAAELIGTARPRVLFQSESFWAHGLNVGLVFQF